MSVDYYLACDHCKKCYHVAQVGLGGFSFYSGERRCMDGIGPFLDSHLYCPGDVRVICEHTVDCGNYEEICWPGDGGAKTIQHGDELNWYYGPTETDPEPSKMWHNGCGGEVMFLEDGYICGKCGQQSEG